MQTRALHSLAIITRNLHGVPHSIQFRVDLGTFPIARDTRQQQSLFAQCRIAAHTPQALFTPTHGHCRTASNAKRAFATLPRHPCITLYYNFSLFSVAFSPLSISFWPILRQTELIVQLNIPHCLSFGRTPPDKPVCSQSSHASSLRYAATSRLHALYASCSLTFRQVRHSFCRRTAVRRPAPTLSAPSIPASGAGKRISLRSRFMWNMRLVIRQNLNVYRGFCSFMHIYTLRHCMFFAYPFAFSAPAILSPLSLRGWRSRLGAAPPFLFPSPSSPPGLAVFVGARLHSVFSLPRLPLFDFSISFCLMPMAHRKLLFVCFL